MLPQVAPEVKRVIQEFGFPHPSEYEGLQLLREVIIPKR